MYGEETAPAMRQSPRTLSTGVPSRSSENVVPPSTILGKGELNLEFKDGLPHPNSNHNPSVGTANALNPYMSKTPKAGIDNPYRCRD
jgi:hypothetical protein